MATFAERLTELIESRNIKKKALAEYLDIEYRTLRYYELGQRKPDFDGLIKLADYFDIPIDFLVGRSGNPKRC